MLTKARALLHKFYGYDSFRPAQEKIIASLLAKNDTVAIMPTGAGKSICFQIPALLLPGVTLVVSPLISLMKDQVDALTGQGIPATFINSSLSAADVSRRMYDIGEKRYKLIYVAPERLCTDYFQSILGKVAVSMVAIDEAHCLSQWGHDFRPSYQAIYPFVHALPERPIIGAFTATATPEVKDDIASSLGLRRPAVYVSGFDRPNLHFSVLRGEDKQQFILNYLKNHADWSGIIYAATRKDVDALSALLADRGYKAGRYHAGMPDQERCAQQEDFLYDNIQTIVATNAFGMGIDKSNVRYVIHYNMPKNMEAYYQEAGRAGRDGEPGECILLFSSQDTMLQKFLIDKSVEDPERKHHELKKLQAMVGYCHTPDCLRKYIVGYFGEAGAPETCGNCASCNDESERVDITVDAQKVFSCIYRMRERFGVSMIADVLKGSKNKKVLQFGFDQLPTYGLFSERSANEIKALIQRLTATEYLALSDGEYPVVKLTKTAFDVMKGEASVWQKVVKIQQAAADTGLFNALKNLRKAVAADEGVPPYLVFSDSTLRNMCEQLPRDTYELGKVKGVGEIKLAKYGGRFLETIAKYAPAAARKTPKKAESGGQKTEKTPVHLLSAKLFGSGMTIAEIAKARGVAESTIQNHLIRAGQEGEDIDWNRLIPEEYESDILAAVKKLGAAPLRPIKEALPPDVGYEAIKAVIAKYGDRLAQ